MPLGITMPSRTAPIERIAEYASWADAAGFDSIWTYELYRNPFSILCMSAAQTKNAQLATGLATAFPRSPFECANAAADVDEISGGRMLLGLGGGVPEFLQAFHSTDAKRMIARMSEYIDVLRLSWEHLATSEPAEYKGEHYQFVTPPFNPWGLREMVRPRIPIYLAGMRPKLQNLCGEKADGWLGYLATPKYMEEIVKPNIEAGAQKAGRSIDDIELSCEIICCVHPDRDVAMSRAKRHLGFYIAHPVSDVVAEIEGVLDDVNALRMQMFEKGLAAFEETPEHLVDLFTITGTPEECRQKAGEWQKFIPHMALHTSYVPPFDAEGSEDCYKQIVDAFKR